MLLQRAARIAENEARWEAARCRAAAKKASVEIVTAEKRTETAEQPSNILSTDKIRQVPNIEERLSEINWKLLVLLGIEGLYEVTHSKVVNKNPIMAAGIMRNDAADKHSSSSSSSQLTESHTSKGMLESTLNTME